MSDSPQPSSPSQEQPSAPVSRWVRLLAGFEPTALRITFGFFLFSSLWILLADELLVKLVKDPDLIGELAMLKGLAFVAISSLLLYGILNRYFIVLKEENRERRRTEEELRTSRTLQQVILDGTTNAVYVKDLAGRYLLFNRGAENFVGKKAAEVIGRDDHAIFPPADAAGVMAGDRAVMEGGVVKIYEEKVTGSTGELLTFLSTKGPVRDESGRVIGLFGVAHDITKRKQAEEQVRESELRYRALCENMHQGFAYCRMVYDERHQPADFVYHSVNQSFGRLTGLESVEGRTATELIPGVRELMPEVFAFYGRVATTGNAETMELYSKPFKRWLNISAYSPAPGFFAAVYDDITARRQTEAQLHIQTKALEAAANGIVITNLEGRILWVNKAFTLITGYAAEEAIGGKPSLLKSGQHHDDFYREMWTTILRGEVWRGELCNRRKDGSLYTEDMTITPVPGADGEISHFIAIKQDITTRKQAELALRESEELFREMAETIDEVFWVFDPRSQRTIYASPAFEKIWGRTLTNLYATSLAWAEPIHPEDRARVLAAFAAAIARGSYEEQYRVVQPGGTVRWVRDRGFPVRDARGTVTKMVGIAEDVTDRHRIEEQFRQAQKLEAIGTLAGGIAHDFNNILAAIIGFTELARMRVKDNPEVSEYLASVMLGSERAVALVRQILAFSRGQEQAMRPLQLKQIVSESLCLMRATIPSSIDFEVNLPGNLATVLADPTQVQQIVMNLCTNASHAMKNRSGLLGVKLENVTVDGLTAAGHPTLQAGPYVRLTVSDTGHGMNDETKKRIFEPFFTTKGPGEGTGLGLSVVHGIMQSYNGVITVYSQPDVGTTFHLYFPAQPKAVADPAAPAMKIPKGHGERILLVDDEKPIVKASQQVLADLGYRAEYRTSATEALAAVRAAPSEYDLVITDLTMPKMTGVELTRQLLALRPDLRIILSTGFSASLTPEMARAMGIRELLLKPHTVQSLATAVHRVLAEPNPRPPMPHILLIDDDDLFRTMLRATLCQMGYKVTEARNGQEGMALYAQIAPDLVLTDLIMPEKEGLETIMDLRRKYPGVKIIAMSGGGRGNGEDYLKMAKAMGARRVFAKPFVPDELAGAIDEVLGQPKK